MGFDLKDGLNLMSKKIFFHVGFQKTGSTFIQQQVFSDLGVNLVTRGFTVMSSEIASLQFAPSGAFRDNQVRDMLLRLVGDSSVEPLVISDEDFVGLPYKNFFGQENFIQRLSSLQLDVEIILFIRGQIALVKSMHNQYVKSGRISFGIGPKFISGVNCGLTLDERFTAPYHPDFRRPFSTESNMCVENFDFDGLVRQYEKHFKKVHVFLYEDLVVDPLEVVRKLASVLGVPCPDGWDCSNFLDRPNPRLGAHSFFRRIMFNRVSCLLGLRATNLIPAWLLDVAACPLRMRNDASGDFYLRRIFRDSNIAASNRALSKRHQLDMESYPESYFNF